MQLKRAAAVFAALIAMLPAFCSPAFYPESSAESGAPSAASGKENPAAALYTATSGYKLNYRIYRSPSYDRKEDSMPALLLLCFHDDPGKGDDNRAQLGDRLISRLISAETGNLFKDCRYIVAAPQCPKGESFAPLPAGGSAYSAVKTPETEIMAAVEELVREIEATEILFQPLRILVAGAGAGASAAYNFSCRHSEMVSMVLAVGGSCDPTSTAVLHGAGIRFLIFAENDNRSIKSLVSETESMFDNSLPVQFTEGSFADCLSFALSFGEPPVEEWAIRENYFGKNFKVTASCNEEGGRIEVSPKSVSYGGSAEVTLTLKPGYALKEVKINGAETDVTVFSRSENNERQYICKIENITQEKSLAAELVRVACKSRFSGFTDRLTLSLSVISALFIAAACVVFAVTYLKKRREQ